MTEYAFDTVRNLNFDSCSTSKLSLSLKSEIFDDFTLTPDEPKVVVNCEFEDFTLTPEGSFSETMSEANQSAAPCESLIHKIKTDSVDSEDLTRKDESITSNEVMMIVDKFLANEKLLYERRNENDRAESIYPSTSTTDTEQRQNVDDGDPPGPLNDNQSVDALDSKRNQSFSSTDTDEKFSIVDMDEESIKNAVVSAFTSEITKEFDLLFSRAQLENDECLMVAEDPESSNETHQLTVHVQSLQQRMP